MSGEERQVGPLSDWVAQPGDLVLEESIPDVFARQLPAIGDRTALCWLDGDELVRLPWSELATRVGSVAGAIAAVTEPGDRVVVWSRNEVEYVIAILASALAGTVLAPFNTAWSEEELRHALDLVEPTLVLPGSTPTGEPVLPLAQRLAGDARLVELSHLEQWARGIEPAPLPSVAPTAPFLIQFTSGTTGRSKGAIVTHRGAINGALQRNVHDMQPENDIWLNPVPYHHIGGSCFVVIGSVIGGSGFVVMPRWSPDEVVRLIGTGVVTRIGGVPTMLYDLMNRLGDAARDAGIASVSLGGSALPIPLVERIRDDLGAPTLNSYGQSECPLITSTLITDPPARLTTIGRPLPAANVRLVDPESLATVPIGTPGEITVRSPNVTPGYWNNPEASAALFTPDGYLRTGDLGSMDETGYLTYIGRVRDVIIRGGENIYPAEVEDLLHTHPDVTSAVLVGLDDPRLGEQVAAVVVAREGATVTGADLAAFLEGRIARFKIPVAWRFVDRLPMTASGKVRRFVVREETNAELGGG